MSFNLNIFGDNQQSVEYKKSLYNETYGEKVEDYLYHIEYNSEKYSVLLTTIGSDDFYSLLITKDFKNIKHFKESNLLPPEFYIVFSVSKDELESEVEQLVKDHNSNILHATSFYSDVLKNFKNFS